uniref:Uncharacterized protein n=1 Tax=Caenorhabditis japonica TaxID=281687 RepID=A0A8R1I817_CAEJA
MKFPDEHISKVSMFVANSITVPRRTDEEEQFEIEKLPFIVPELIRAKLQECYYDGEKEVISTNIILRNDQFLFDSPMFCYFLLLFLLNWFFSYKDIFLIKFSQEAFNFEA